jgi:aryl-alcohol dehydrogenase-like predicted oxidoreductase
MIPMLTLPGTSLRTTALGFGCNSLLGPRSRREAFALLAAAFDAGIRHFDVARAYSSGDAEGVLGEFLSGRRDEVTVTTKFGLLPPQGTLSRMRRLKAIARMVMRVSPRLRRLLGRQSARMVQSGSFSVDQASASLETSLRELRTDRIDLLLLHEAGPADCSDELLAFLDRQLRSGRIGAYGTGSNFGRIQEVIRDRPAFARVIQFDSSVMDRNRECMPLSAESAVITHGSLSGFGRLQTFLSKRSTTCRLWSDALGVDLAVPNTLAALMLAHALHANRGGIVLFSSTRVEAIQQNSSVGAGERFQPDQLLRFAELVRDEFN